MGLTLEDLVEASQASQRPEAPMVAMTPPASSVPPPEDDSAVSAMGGDRLRQDGIEEPNALDMLNQIGFFSNDGVDREELDALDIIDDEPDVGEEYYEEDDDMGDQL